MMEPIDFFSTFMTADMIRNIVGHTNEEIVLRSSKYKEQTATISSTCEEELTALLGLLLLSAAKKDNHLTSLELFDPTFSGTRYISRLVQFGVSGNTIRRIVDKGIKNGGKFVTPRKHRKGRLKEEIDDLNLCAIRQKVHLFYTVQKGVPTQKKKVVRNSRKQPKGSL
ncbi:unnamed protein product [Parnassius apollo]|uniref:(apollo) hypothetical protein n=1 Tax=Parnassius apollo TaxID=110799 RepID=A0A8S3WRC9_PARAO|nr:unnamed protein product [Parnassius apollo]